MNPRPTLWKDGAVWKCVSTSESGAAIGVSANPGMALEEWCRCIERAEKNGPGLAAAIDQGRLQEEIGE